MRDVLTDWDRMTSAGAAVGRAVVTRVWGSAPRAEGACLLADREGGIAGSVSGGCIESAAAEAIVAAMERGTPVAVSYGVSDEQAWEVGLACGGTLDVFVEPAVRPELVEVARGPGGVVFATIIDGGERAGWSWVVRDDGTIDGPVEPVGRLGPGDQPVPGELDDLTEQVQALAHQVLADDRSRTHTVERSGGTIDVFFELVPRQPRLVVFGGVHIAVPLVTMAQQLGYYAIVADARQGFLTKERFPTADELVLGWPGDAFEKIGLDPATCVVVLSHDPKLDDPALEIALRSPARYVGAIGSRKTQSARRERLAAAGVTPEQLARLHGPVGLDLGGRAPAETALAILAEITAVRYGKPTVTSSGKAR
jgi:xanthine dehydrogenase accessory factor